MHGANAAEGPVEGVIVSAGFSSSVVAGTDDVAVAVVKIVLPLAVGLSKAFESAVFCCAVVGVGGGVVVGVGDGDGAAADVVGAADGVALRVKGARGPVHGVVFEAHGVAVGVGDGGEKLLIKAIRIHGNFSEYIPLSLILLACYELNGASALWMHALGATLFVGRILHAVGLSSSLGTSKPRLVGMMSTFTVILILAIENIRMFLVS